MRYSKATVAADSVRASAYVVRRIIVVAAIAVLAAWGAYAFAQEAYIGHRLSQQVAEQHRLNASLAAQNSGYRKDVQSVTSGAANEEQARLSGYARAQERLYLVTAPPSPTPPAPGGTPAP
jgi:cell division protein FtsB